MSALPIGDVKSLATVTVTFNPDITLLETQLRALPSECVKFVVDNASQSEITAQIEALTERLGNVHILRNSSNAGLAAAVNHGVNAASGLPVRPRFVLLLDQDSEPLSGSIDALVAAFLTLEDEGNKVGCVGPLLRDPDTGLTHGFHQSTHWRWKRIYPSSEATASVSCANLNGSGTLVSLALFQRLGGLDEALFIDHVDTEWAFRVLESGYTLWGIPNAVFKHRMGQSSFRFWCFGWRLWPSRSPQRHYYLFRNAMCLLRRTYVPNVWKAWAVAKLVLTLSVCALFDSRRGAQIANMLRGLRDGSRMEKYGNARS